MDRIIIHPLHVLGRTCMVITLPSFASLLILYHVHVLHVHRLPLGTLIFGVVVLYAEVSRRYVKPSFLFPVVGLLTIPFFFCSGNHRDIAKVESYRYKFTSL
jgi:hypothetical protein